MTQIPERIRFHRVLIETLVRERDDMKTQRDIALDSARAATSLAERWQKIARSRGAHPFRNLWDWLRREP